MSTPPKRKPFFERLRTGLDEGIQFARGELNLRTTLLPERPPEFEAADVIRLRQRLNMTQGVFAQALNVSTKTLQSWEQGTRRPSQAALRLLQVLKEKPAVVCSVLGINEQALTATRHGKSAAKAGGNRRVRGRS
jgi:putative transcriptional regulator